MDRRSIDVGVLSYPAPLAAPDDLAGARQGARSVNEYTAEVVKGRPDRFGHFAALPLPDVDGALAEAAHALDVLRANGMVVLSNAHGRYLGDPAFEPLWAELDARAAVVLVHPTAPPGPPVPGLPGPLVDFPYDTARTALHMALAGVPGRYPRMRLILPHTGGFLPYAAQRFAVAAHLHPGSTPEGLLAELRRFSFDTALSAGPAALPSLLAFAEPGHVLYGRTGAPASTRAWTRTRTGGTDSCTPSTAGKTPNSSSRGWHGPEPAAQARSASARALSSRSSSLPASSYPASQMRCSSRRSPFATARRVSSSPARIDPSSSSSLSSCRSPPVSARSASRSNAASLPSSETVRGYHDKGLLPEPDRDASGYRRYGAGDAIELIKIRTLAEAGVPLARVRDLRGATDEEFQRALREIDEELTARIRGLRARQGRLRRLATGDLAPLPAEIPALIQSTVNAASPAWRRLDTLIRGHLTA
ncbi:amidohydrolase family protein [Streptomyces sp. NPDC059193]|uniref:amidohydrolase family protein n=1 Tax=Streptomyces sp. NPDC059193 TaxID=3346763 RepID=UPI00367B22B3